MDCSTIRCIAGFLARFPESTDSRKYRLLRQDSSMDAASPSDTTGGSFRFHFTPYRNRLTNESAKRRLRMVYSHQMVDTVSRSSCRHDHTCAGKVAEPEIRKSNPADSDTGTGNDSQYVPTERSEQKVYSYRARRRIKPHRERKEKKRHR